MGYYKEEAEHLLNKLVHACRIDIDNKELAIDIIEESILQVVEGESLGEPRTSCGHDEVLNQNIEDEND